MQITITILSDELHRVEVSENLELENFRGLCEVETGIPSAEIVLVCNGRPLVGDKRTLKELEIKNSDIVLVQSLHDQARLGGIYRGPNVVNQPFPDHSVYVRDFYLDDSTRLATLKEVNPPLAEALLTGDLEIFHRVMNEQRNPNCEALPFTVADTNDPRTQQLIEEAIRLRNVESNMRSAIEFDPESFGQVHMLYVDCKVNGYPVKAFVDSGAQTTIMSQRCAEQCQIMRLVDYRFRGVAKGVGAQPIIGRVHLCQIQIGNAFFQSSFYILENTNLDMLLGLDMLKRHQCMIDLKTNMLRIGTTGTATPFLAEADLPDFTCLNGPDQSNLNLPVSGTSGPTTSSKPSTSGVAQVPSGNQVSEEIVERLMANGFSRHVVMEELRRCNGNTDQALASLLTKSFSKL